MSTMSDFLMNQPKAKKRLSTATLNYSLKGNDPEVIEIDTWLRGLAIYHGVSVRMVLKAALATAMHLDKQA